jgi:undecaprenyl-diphosphatase
LGRSRLLVPGAGLVGIWAIAAGRSAEGLSVIVGMLGAVIVQNVDKAIIGRPRPPVAELEHVSGASFPSGHATEATAFFLLMLVAIPPGAWSRRPVRWLAVVATTAVITCIALSRVYLGVHYPTDIAAGILLGGAWSVLTVRILLAPAAA